MVSDNPNLPKPSRSSVADVVATIKYDAVTKPEHYQTPSGLQAVDVVEQFELDSHVDQAVIYLLRAGKKDEATFDQDVRKAIWWLARKIKLPQDAVNALLRQEASSDTPVWMLDGLK